MVVLLRFGIFSVVRHPVTPGLVAVRARVRDHLADLLGAADIDARIQATPTRDYAFRAHLDVVAWRKLIDFLGETAAGTANVKDSIAERHGLGSDLYRLASDVWHLGLKLQHQAGPARRAPAPRRLRP